MLMALLAPMLALLFLVLLVLLPLTLMGMHRDAQGSGSVGEPSERGMRQLWGSIASAAAADNFE